MGGKGCHLPSFRVKMIKIMSPSEFNLMRAIPSFDCVIKNKYEFRRPCTLQHESVLCAYVVDPDHPVGWQTSEWCLWGRIFSPPDPVWSFWSSSSRPSLSELGIWAVNTDSACLVLLVRFFLFAFSFSLAVSRNHVNAGCLVRIPRLCSPV